MKREDDLRNRVASLESLVHRLNGDEVTSSGPAEISPSSDKYMAGPFWSSLAGEVHALKEALEDDDDESDMEREDSNNSGSGLGSSPSVQDPTQNANDAAFEFMLCGPTSILVLPDALYEVGSLISSDLFEVHLQRVDRSAKVFHAPSLRALTQHRKAYLGFESDAPCNLALKAVVQFSAISQLMENECEQRYGQPRAGLLDRLQRTAEIRLIQADPMNSTALPTLQALLLYVVS